jgi:hypothetical protein
MSSEAGNGEGCFTWDLGHGGFPQRERSQHTFPSW